MQLEYIAVWLIGSTIVFSLLSIIFALVVVWKVEKLLDVSFKLFLWAIVFFVISEIILYFSVGTYDIAYILAIICKFFFALLFFMGMVYMRKMIKRVEKDIK